MTDDVFSGQNQAQQTTQIDPDKSYVEQLVGEGKKFKDAEAMAKGKVESDTYIETLTKKLDDISAELEKRMTAEEIADQIRSKMQPPASTQTPNPGDGENADGTNQNTNQNQQNFSTDDIERLLEQKIEEKSKVSKATANLDEANKVLREKIGVTANQYLSDKASEMGVSLEYLKEQAAVSPKAFFNMIGLNQPSASNTGFNPPSSSVSTIPSGGTERNEAYYTKLYKESPNLRLDKDTSIQEHKDRMRLRDKFYS